MKLGKLLLFFLIFILSVGIFNVTIHYFDPNFEKGFLKGKSEFYVQSIFRISLFTHGFSASICAVFIAFLVFFRWEKKYSSLHRFLGKISLILTICIVFPSALILSLYADGGKIARLLFLFLSVITCYSGIIAYSFARKKMFINHEIWMKYLLVLFSSAFILRIIIVIFFYLKIHSKAIYPLEVFLCFVPSSILFWVISYKKLHSKRIKS